MTAFSLPEPVAACCRTLRAAGFAAYPVGGCVRDLLLGRTPGDWDIAASARPEQVMALFACTVPTGVRHGTVTVLLDGFALEVTTFRREGGYADGRHPGYVTFDAGLTDDLARRDFTVNAMALGAGGEVIDPFGGRADLDSRLIRAVGEPEERFREDALRILRGVRFAAQLGFELEGETAAAMEACAPLVNRVSPQRIRVEVEKVLCSPNPAWMGRLISLGVLDRFYQNWPPGCDYAALAAAEPTPAGRWAAFCALTGFPITALPVERALRMAILHPERAAVKGLALTGGELAGLGFQGTEIGRVQRLLAGHVLEHPEDNEKARLRQLALRARGENDTKGER